MSSSADDPGRPALSPEALHREIVLPGSLWTSLRVATETASTNADLARAAAGGAPEGAVLVAESQTGGRGRLGRAWVSPPRAGLTFSVLLRPGSPRAAWAWLSLLTGVSVARALAQVADVDALLKWPNDVLLGTGKVAGLLAEVAGDAVVVGVGLNVSTGRAELPRAAATSLFLEQASCTDRAALLAAILRCLAEDYRGWLDGADPRPRYVAACATVGQRVRVTLPDGELTGDAVDVDPGGALVVKTDDGRHTSVAAGDVVHLRPTVR
ncbi:MAG: biotin--[acetyl-CoA-carboxylase] ligase [bacterium]